jgi:hypothetical protein
MLLPIIQQIALANESLGGGSIVILSSVPKITLEKLIEAENMNLYGSGQSSSPFVPVSRPLPRKFTTRCHCAHGVASSPSRPQKCQCDSGPGCDNLGG